MFSFFKAFSDKPVEATVRSNTFAIAVDIEPLYSLLLPNTILSAAILPCLFAGPARYVIVGFFVIGCGNSIASPIAYIFG